jgi:hypothetical protein
VNVKSKERTASGVALACSGNGQVHLDTDSPEFRLQFVHPNAKLSGRPSSIVSFLKRGEVLMCRAFCKFRGTAILAIVFSGMAAAQEQKKDSTPAQAQDSPFVKPAPEHEIFKKEVGVWDATVEMKAHADGEPMVSKGVETNTLLGPGLWLIQDFKGEMMGAPFQGHGVTGYDPLKKKYVGTWVDSMSTGLATTQGTYDPKSRVMTTHLETSGPDGAMMKMRSTSEWKDANTRVFTMYSPAGQGDEYAMMKITYKRRGTAPGPRATH